MRQLVRFSRISPLRVVLVAVLAVAIAACGIGGGSTPRADALKVVTTTTVFADIVQNVGGSRVAATSIIPS